jgi:hypothetical protein
MQYDTLRNQLGSPCACLRSKIFGVFERYTESARRALFFARYEVGRLIER